MLIMGIDASKACTGLFLLDYRPNGILEYVDTTIIVPSSTKKADNYFFLEFGSAFQHILNEWKPDIIVREETIPSSSHYTRDLLAMQKGVMKLMIGDYGIKSEASVHPKTLKRVVGGHGSCSKDTLAAAAREYVDIPESVWETLINDQTDALALIVWYVMTKLKANKIEDMQELLEEDEMIQEALQKTKEVVGFESQSDE